MHFSSNFTVFLKKKPEINGLPTIFSLQFPTLKRKTFQLKTEVSCRSLFILFLNKVKLRQTYCSSNSMRALMASEQFGNSSTLNSLIN